MLGKLTIVWELPATYANDKPQSWSIAKMTDNTALIKKVTLIAREQNLPPLGVPVNPQRNIGFASVFVRLENPKQTLVTIKILKIEIRNLSSGQLQDFQQPPKEIQLKPLENSELVFQLTNKTGFTAKDKVQAIVTYNIGEQRNIIESQFVEINR